MKSLLILGGARSGKSRYGQARIESMAGPLTYIATAQAFDEEMAERIAHHRVDRGRRWRTVEAPLDLPEAIGMVQEGAVLVDCLTLWVSNLILAERDCDAAGEALCAAVADCRVPIALIANEVGLGIVPDNALARRFRDAAGWLNQRLAKTVDEVVFVAAGLPLFLKSEA
ncbi:adenosylcobinamide kinase/adenosylcobinamide-phosphate guanylyltransferase [Novosphingobium sp. SG751A]|uniref:bifunctional adenosylcobinamide kinase/adenosylcobinamide-phosphate guanylyltransferase n=1 Tax=Novosphingobium sp. SG751A TaxID=2587000 RepID=UPI0015539E45|nr:bifunctional adenosylcobinamide kinase/adenosylcobinamide-phosphate guanylyltransferase [Novosphingobium sp. SG751A]NOW45816.1 adenosylcobinamide kinase/adenosylcobinamide-phosphate guanylyltransferase [Novosphingobium sp. SG751A]